MKNISRTLQHICTLILCLLLFSNSASTSKAGDKHVYAETAIISRIISVYDGDTFRCDLADYPSIIGKNIGIRVNGIDTPEIRDKRPEIKALAVEARDYVRRLLTKAHTIELRNLRRGKYFRIVADVHLDGVSLAQQLIEGGYAHSYDGGTKNKW